MRVTCGYPVNPRKENSSTQRLGRNEPSLHWHSPRSAHLYRHHPDSKPTLRYALPTGAPCDRSKSVSPTIPAPVIEPVITKSPEEFVSEIQLLTADYINAVVGEIFNDDDATWTGETTVQQMNVTSIGVGTVALLKCSGTASTTAGAQSWSAIVKIVEPDAPNAFGSTDPNSSVWSEIWTYRESLFAPQSSGFRGAGCYRVDDRGDGQFWIWMEDLSDYSGAHWSRDEYMLAATGIGQFNGAWLNKDVSAFEWLPRSSRDASLESNATLLENQENFLKLKDSEYFREGLPGNKYDQLISLRALIPNFVKAATQVPDTLGHNDCHIRNLFAAPDLSEIVAIDFARVALAPVGGDAGDLLGSSFMWTDPEAETAMPIADEIYAAWISGLKSTGWNGSNEIARFGFLFPTLRRAIMVPGMLAWVALGSDFPLRRYGDSKEEMPASIRRRFEFLLPLIDEAKTLAEQINS